MRKKATGLFKKRQDNINIERQQRQTELKAMQNNAALVEKQFAKTLKLLSKILKTKGLDPINAQG